MPLVADDYLYGAAEWDDLYVGGNVVDMKPDQDFEHSITYVLYDENASLEGPYYVAIRALDYTTGDRYWQFVIEKAAFGHFDSREKFDAAPDIKDELCDRGDGYLTTFTDGMAEFTIKTFEDETLHHFQIALLNQKQFSATEEHEYAGVLPAALYYRPNFDMDYALNENHEAPAKDMDINDHNDSYYIHGYQTIFQSDKIPEGATIYPKFYSDNSIYVGTDNASGVKQISEETPVVFHSGQPIRYSAAVSDGEHLSNYWVTFVTPQTGGAKLFVNAASNIDDSHRDAVEKGADGKGLPVREVYLNSSYFYIHDILIANIGDEELTGLSVKLVGDLNDESVPPKNVRLDETWAPTANEPMSLPAFNEQALTTESPASVGWENMTKIRLLTVTDADGKVQEGEVSGYLVITSDNGGSMTVKLVGEAVEPRVVTETLETVEHQNFHAVRFVHYSTFLQTNSMYAKDKVKFTLLDGELPKGVTEDMDVKLYPNGELYGVPAEVGEYEFVVRATFYGDERIYDDKQYTLIVEDNTDENVNAISDYKLIQTKAGDYDPAVGYDPDTDTLTLHSEAPFALFVDKVTLDGEELRPGIDYEAWDGSQNIVARGLSSRLSEEDSHTFSVESRDGEKMTRTAANPKPAESKAPSGKNNKSDNSKTDNKSAVKSKERTPSRTPYAIHVAAASHGSVSVSAGAAVSGTMVTITLKPNAGYAVKSVSVEGVNIKGAVAVKSSNGRYTFTMPAKQVRVKATFASATTTSAKTPETTEAQVKTLPGADDVKVTDWFYADVAWAYGRGVLNGYADGAFRPATLTSCAAVILTLGRLDKADLTPYATANDGWDNNAKYASAARWATAKGILPAGVPFGGYAPMTRGELAVILRNYLNYRGIKVQPSGTFQFSDAEQMTEEQREAFQILNEAGIFRGDSTAAMLPQNYLHRAHLAALLHRLSDYIIKIETTL